MSTDSGVRLADSADTAGCLFTKLMSELAMHFQTSHSSSLLLTAFPAPDKSLATQSLRSVKRCIAKNLFCSEQFENVMLLIILLQPWCFRGKPIKQLIQSKQTKYFCKSTSLKNTLDFRSCGNMGSIEQRCVASMPRFLQIPSNYLHEKKLHFQYKAHLLTCATQRSPHTPTSIAHSSSLKAFNRRKQEQRDLVRWQRIKEITQEI